MATKSKKLGLSKNFWTYTFYAVLALAVILLTVMLFGKPIERFTNGGSSKSKGSKGSTKTLEYFYMPSCPHCKDFNPVWDEVTSKISEEDVAVRTQKLNLLEDGEEHGKKYNVNAAPTILLITDDGDVKEYKGPREADAIMSFIKDN